MLRPASTAAEALVLDPKNVRGLVRRAQCLIAQHQHKASLVTKRSSGPVIGVSR